MDKYSLTCLTFNFEKNNLDKASYFFIHFILTPPLKYYCFLNFYLLYFIWSIFDLFTIVVKIFWNNYILSFFISSLSISLCQHILFYCVSFTRITFHASFYLNFQSMHRSLNLIPTSIKIVHIFSMISWAFMLSKLILKYVEYFHYLFCDCFTYTYIDIWSTII